MASSPWSCLVTKRFGEITDGEWFASCKGTHNASVNLAFDADGVAELTIDGFYFDAQGFRELAEFSNRVAKQLEGEGLAGAEGGARHQTQTARTAAPKCFDAACGA